MEIKNAMIVDASLIDAHSRPRRKVTVTVEPTGDDVFVDDAVETNVSEPISAVKVHIEESKDTEVRWLKKREEFLLWL